MSFSHGSTAVIKFGTSGATSTPTDISAYVKSVSFPEEVETHETTTLGATSKSYIAGLKDATISIDGVFDPTVDEHLNGILGLEVAFEYYPQGTDSGSVKYSGQCICVSYEAETPVDDVGTFSAEFQVSGDVSRSTVP